jgi:hypothetical protein
VTLPTDALSFVAGWWACWIFVRLQTHRARKTIVHDLNAIIDWTITDGRLKSLDHATPKGLAEEVKEIVKPRTLLDDVRLWWLMRRLARRQHRSRA